MWNLARTLGIPLALFAFALVLRLVYIADVAESPFFHNLNMDSEVYDELAQELAFGNGFPDEVFYQAPLYPAFLSLIYRVAGHDLHMVRIVQAILGALSAVLVYYLGRRLFSRACGIIASLLFGGYWTLIYFDGEVLIPGLIIFLDLLMILAMVLALDRKSYLLWLVCGLLLGLSAVARTNILVFAPAVIAACLIHRFSMGTALRMGLFVIGTVIVVLPVTLHNHDASGEWILVSYNGGLNFYIGNNPDYDKTVNVRPGIGWEKLNAMPLFAVDKLTPKNVSDFYYGRSFDYIKSEPLDYLALLCKKTVLFLSGFELMRNRDITFFVDNYSWLLKWPLVGFAVLLPLALLGIIVSFRNGFSIVMVLLFIALYAFSVILFFVTARYRLPVVPFLALFAGHGLLYLFELLKNKRLVRTAVICALLAGLGLVSRVDFYGVNRVNYADGYLQLGQIHLSNQELDQAEQAFLKAEEHDPRNPDVLFELGNLHFQKGHSRKAREKFTAAAETEPGFARAYLRLADIASQKGNLDLAIKKLEDALEADRFQLATYLPLAKGYRQKGRFDAAVELLEQGLQIQPGRPDLLLELGSILLIEKKFDKAVGHMKRALEVNPDLAPVHFMLGSAYLEMERFDEALHHYSRAVELNPRDCNTLNNLGILYARDDQPAKAVEMWERSLAINPGQQAVIRFIEQMKSGAIRTKKRK